MQCKDISDLPILNFLYGLRAFLYDGQRPETWHGRTGTRYTYLDNNRELPDNSVFRAMPENTPEKLGLAKMKMLMRRELVDGCGCGCGGSFELTPKGVDYLFVHTQP